MVAVWPIITIRCVWVSAAAPRTNRAVSAVAPGGDFLQVCRGRRVGCNPSDDAGDTPATTVGDLFSGLLSHIPSTLRATPGCEERLPLALLEHVLPRQCSNT